MRSVLISFVVLTTVLVLTSALLAEVPHLINYQGILTDADGSPLEGTHDLVFRIYPDSAQGADDLWAERYTGIMIDDGLFNIILGSIATIPYDLFANGERWLGIQVDANPEMRPRMRITSVPWAMRAAVADSATANDGDWQISENDMYSGVTGKVGVGTSSPLADLHIEQADISLPEPALYNDVLIVEDSDAGLGLYSDGSGSYGSSITLGEIDGGVLDNKWSLYRTTEATPGLRFSFGTNADFAANQNVLCMLSNGNVGIGREYPTRNLDIYDTSIARMRIASESATGSVLELKSFSTAAGTWLGRIEFLDIINNVDASIQYCSVPFFNEPGMYFNVGGPNRMFIHSSTGYVGIGTTDPDEMLHVTGTVKAGILKLSSGADIAEPFDVEGTAGIKSGMVVAIDSESPGKLKICNNPYDRCVAGIISGAGDLEPGMLMGQEGSVADGEHPVALTGRVYCWADASNGPISPGDLLTTSDTPGHAMKVTDYERAQGAVIGKAMSSLEAGQGLVLVLVTLQ